MKLSRKQPGENKGHGEPVTFVADPHRTFHWSLITCPMPTSGAAPFVSLALLVVQATPHPEQMSPGSFFFFPWVKQCGRPVSLAPRTPQAGVPTEVSVLPVPQPSPDCLPRYWKPLCSHCVGAVIFEVPGVISRSLLERNPLAHSDHSPCHHQGAGL